MQYYLKCSRKRVFTKLLSFRETSEYLSYFDFGVFASEVTQMLQATPPKARREAGMCSDAANQRHNGKQKNSRRIATAAQQRRRRQTCNCSDAAAIHDRKQQHSYSSGNYVSATIGSIRLSCINKKHKQPQQQQQHLPFLDFSIRD